MTSSTGIAGIALKAETFWKAFALSQDNRQNIYSRARFNSL
jgi:hypothetical protein